MAYTGKKPPLKRSDWQVRSVDIAVADRIVRDFHYAKGASNTATYLHGVFPKDSFWEQDCRGVSWWIPPTKAAAQALAGDNWTGVLALSRLAVSPDMPGNTATFLMARSIAMIDRDVWPVLVTYADSWRGHTGAIYEATGWRKDGETAKEAVWTLHGRMVARKAGGHTRTTAEMRALGAELQGRFSKTRFVMDARPCA